MTFPIERFKGLKTPLYYYDLHLLDRTLSNINNHLRQHPNFHVHYAVKANANPVYSTSSHPADWEQTVCLAGKLKQPVLQVSPAMASYSPVLERVTRKSNWH